MNKVCVLLLSVIFIFSCKLKSTENENLYVSLKDTLYIPFDTVRVIKMMNIDYSKTTKEISKELDTLYLKYKSYACDCPSWVKKECFDKLDNADSMYRECSFYIEPINSNVELDDNICSFQNEIMLIGKLRTNEGYPSNSKFIDPNPPKGKVFTYYSYKVIFPLSVYGPKYHTGTTEIPELGNKEEELIMTSQLIVKGK